MGIVAGYLFLLIALLSGATKGYCGKKTSGIILGAKNAVFANIIRMLICIVIGFAMLAFKNDLSSLKIGKKEVLISLLSGVTTSLFVVSWLISVKKGAYLMIDVFLTIGTVIPIVLSCIFLNEEIRINQCIGFAILLVAVIIMCSYNNSIKTKLNISSIVLLLVVGILNGLTSFSQTLYIKTVANANIAGFSFYTYVFSTIMAHFLFKEKLTIKCVVGLVIAFISLLIINW